MEYYIASEKNETDLNAKAWKNIRNVFLKKSKLIYNIYSIDTNTLLLNKAIHL